MNRVGGGAIFVKIQLVAGRGNGAWGGRFFLYTVVVSLGVSEGGICGEKELPSRIFFIRR